MVPGTRRGLGRSVRVPTTGGFARRVWASPSSAPIGQWVEAGKGTALTIRRSRGRGLRRGTASQGGDYRGAAGGVGRVPAGRLVLRQAGRASCPTSQQSAAVGLDSRCVCSPCRSTVCACEN